MPRKGEIRVWADDNQFLLQRWTGQSSEKNTGWLAVGYYPTLGGLANGLLNRRARTHIQAGKDIQAALQLARQDMRRILGDDFGEQGKPGATARGLPRSVGRKSPAAP